MGVTYKTSMRGGETVMLKLREETTSHTSCWNLSEKLEIRILVVTAVNIIRIGILIVKK